MSDALTLADLVGRIDTDRRLATEVLRKLPDLVSENGDVTFDLEPAVVVPSIPKLQAELQAGGVESLTQRVAQSEDLVRGLIQETGRLAQELDINRNTPYWNPLDLTVDNEDANTSSPIYRAQVDKGIRFPYDAYTVVPMDRQHDTVGAKEGGVLHPEHSEATIKKYSTGKTFASAATAPAWLNVTQYPAFTRTVTYRRRYWYRYYYGYYYSWWHYRWYGRYYYTYYDRVWTSQVSEPLAASTVGQTFQVDENVTLLGFTMAVSKPGTYKAAANPSVLLVETSEGRPVLDKVIVKGRYRDDAALASVGAYGTMVTVDLDHPAALKAGVSYALIIKAGANWSVGYTPREDATGSLFFTQDGAYWQADLAKDLYYTLRIADYGAITESTIELNALSVSGGIASLFTTLSAEIPEGCEIVTQIKINEVWSDVSVLNDLESLPPYTPVRVIFRGHGKAMPLLNTTESNITAFRPATTLRYLSKSRARTGTGALKVVYEITGYDDSFHDWQPQLDVEGQPLDPLVMDVRVSTDGKVMTANCTYELPVEATEFSHRIEGTTQTATRLFDINSVIEINT